MAINSPRSASVVALAQRRQLLQIQSDATSPVGGGAPADAATLQGHPASDFATAAHTHDYAPAVAYGLLSAEPTPDETWNGRMVVLLGAPGEPSQIKMCIINSIGGFEWVTLGQSLL